MCDNYYVIAAYFKLTLRELTCLFFAFKVKKYDKRLATSRKVFLTQTTNVPLPRRIFHVVLFVCSFVFWQAPVSRKRGIISKKETLQVENFFYGTVHGTVHMKNDMS